MLTYTSWKSRKFCSELRNINHEAFYFLFVSLWLLTSLYSVFSCYFFPRRKWKLFPRKTWQLKAMPFISSNDSVVWEETKIFSSWPAPPPPPRKKMVNQIMPLDFQIKAVEDKNGQNRLRPELMLSRGLRGEAKGFSGEGCGQVLVLCTTACLPPSWNRDPQEPLLNMLPQGALWMFASFCLLIS